MHGHRDLIGYRPEDDSQVSLTAYKETLKEVNLIAATRGEWPLRIKKLQLSART